MYDDLHLDRVRAGSFGSIADQYERYRPPYAEAAFDDLARLGAASVLDIACGTGKVAGPLAAHGLDVLGIEADARMAAVARDRGIDVEVAPFEQQLDADRKFDLVTCGDAWHWIQPEAGAAKVADVLHPGGMFVRLWHFHVLGPDVLEVISDVYARIAPGSHIIGIRHGDISDVDPLAALDAFQPVQIRTYEVPVVVTSEELVGLAGTFSDHQGLPIDVRNELFSALSMAIDTFGDSLPSTIVTHARFVRRTANSSI